MSRQYNFYPGPAVLPERALLEAQNAIWELGNTGVGILEISHRSQAFSDILESAKQRVRNLLRLPSDYEIVFVQGGASMVMAILSMNFIQRGDLVDYIDTGRWSQRAIKEAERQADKVKATVNVVWSGQDSNYTELPDLDNLTFDPNAKFVHMTSNNTVAGTQFPEFPKNLSPNTHLFVDMSSDFLSRPLEIDQFSMIYGGVQKNLGPAGSAMVILHRDLLNYIPNNLSEMLDLSIYVDKNSLYNTPAVFVIYMVERVLAWLEEEIGGLHRMHEINRTKANMLYDYIDNSGGYYYCTVPNPLHRSLMNVTFRIYEPALERVFIDEATQAGFIGLAGHRSVGGMRASLYNSLPVPAVEALVNFMDDFKRNHPF